MPKNAGHGQASIFTDSDYGKIFKHLQNPKHRLLIQVARYTGERWGSICQLRVSDVYADAARRIPHTHVTFRAATRKADPNGKRETRQVPVHENLEIILRAYQPEAGSEWLFPSRLNPAKPFTLRNGDKFLRETLMKAGMDGAGFSTHSTRRTLITTLARSGVSAPVIQKITGHKNMAVLQRYIEVSDEQVIKALAVL